jgi:hypothetical protein
MRHSVYSEKYSLPHTNVIDPGHGGVAKVRKCISKITWKKFNIIYRVKCVTSCTERFRVVFNAWKNIWCALDKRTRIAIRGVQNLFISLHYKSAQIRKLLDLKIPLFVGLTTFDCRNKLNSDDLMQHPANQNDDYSLRLAFEFRQVCVSARVGWSCVRHAPLPFGKTCMSRYFDWGVLWVIFRKRVKLLGCYQTSWHRPFQRVF